MNHKPSTLCVHGCGHGYGHERDDVGGFAAEVPVHRVEDRVTSVEDRVEDYILVSAHVSV